MARLTGRGTRAALILGLVVSCSGVSPPKPEPQTSAPEPVPSEPVTPVAVIEIDASPVDARPDPDASRPIRDWYCHQFRVKRDDDYMIRCYRTLYNCGRISIDAQNNGLDASDCAAMKHAYCYSVRNDLEEYSYIRCFMTAEGCQEQLDRFSPYKNDVVSECVYRD